MDGTTARYRRLEQTLGHLLPATRFAARAGGAASTRILSRQKRVAMKDGHSPNVLAPLPTTPEFYNVKGCDQVGLTQEEAEHFREFGFIIKRGLIPREELRPFVDLWWEQPPVVAAGLSREDKSTWVQPGERWPSDQRWATNQNWLGGRQPWPGPQDARPAGTVGAGVGRLPHGCGGNVWKWHGLGHDPDFVKATSAHPNMLDVVEALLGGPVRRPRRNRGCYNVFPRSDHGVNAKLGPHNDGAPTELMAVTNFSEVGVRSGGFTIWPTSPQQLYPTSEQAYNWMPTPASRKAMDRIRSTVTPLEFVGGPGDVVLVHGLMVHSAGLHQSVDQIRRAVVQDFNKVRARGPLRWTAAAKAGGEGRGVGVSRDGLFVFPTDDPNVDQADGNREVTTPWHHDGNEWVADPRPPMDDMFTDWNLGKSPPIGNIVDEPAWWEKYNLRMLPERCTQRGGGGCPAVRLDQIADYEGDGVWRVRHRGEEWLHE